MVLTYGDSRSHGENIKRVDRSVPVVPEAHYGRHMDGYHCEGLCLCQSNTTTFESHGLLARSGATLIRIFANTVVNRFMPFEINAF